MEQLIHWPHQWHSHPPSSQNTEISFISSVVPLIPRRLWYLNLMNYDEGFTGRRRITLLSGCHCSLSSLVSPSQIFSPAAIKIRRVWECVRVTSVSSPPTTHWHWQSQETPEPETGRPVAACEGRGRGHTESSTILAALHRRLESEYCVTQRGEEGGWIKHNQAQLMFAEKGKFESPGNMNIMLNRYIRQSPVHMSYLKQTIFQDLRWEHLFLDKLQLVYRKIIENFEA